MTFHSKKEKQELPKAACPLCKSKQELDYKKITQLRCYLYDRGKILGREKTGLCQKHQRRMTQAIKRARHLALLPFVIKP